ncbi:MAG: thiolase family protein [Deltaproteobacteria bacterium]|nr:thiolase family protein [Deltaproteobacteria bacterium]
MEDVVIVKGIRTPFGNFGGALKEVTAVELGAKVIRASLDKVSVTDEEIDLVVMGLVLPGSGQSPARQAIIAAGLPLSTNALTVERACCSAMHAVGMGFESISSCRTKIVIAGGMENMSRTPYLVPQMRWGQRLGDITIQDELVIRNPYVKAPMARYAGEVALEWGVERLELDEWAVRSNLTWVDADKKGLFKNEILPVEVQAKKETIVFERDEHPRPDSSVEKLSKLKVVYGSPTITAGNASALGDGAAAILIMSRSAANERGIKPLARVVDHMAVSGEPRNSPMIPGVAIQRILAKNGLTLDDMKLIEINEAFASMPTVSTLYLADKDRKKAEKIRERVNVKGGAISIGHPIGATGARVLMTLAYEMQRRGEHYGIASICGAIGQANVVLLENVD